MNLDKIDLKLIDILYHRKLDERFTTTELTKEILCPSNREEMINFNSLVTSKLKKLIKYGILRREKSNGKYHYYVEHEDIHISDSKIEFLGLDGEIVKTEARLCFFPKDGGIYIISYLGELKK